jgi:hypothetical protein
MTSNINNIYIKGVDGMGCHIIRSINIGSQHEIINDHTEIPNDESSVFSIIMYINEIFTDDMTCCDMCTFCGKNIFGSKIISCCDNQTCKQDYYKNVTNNCVTDLHKKDPMLLKFFIALLVSGCEHPKFESSFKPLPCISGVSSASAFKNIIPLKYKNYDLDHVFKHLKNTDDDIMFKDVVGELEYSIIKNAISDNKFILQSYQNNVIKLSYSAEIEEKFANKQNYLYHGSSMYSWYPIIKNGLQNMSGTKLQMHGAAYGSGMYFSDSFNFACGYARNNGNVGHKVVGVFEIIDDIKTYCKMSQIYVIPNVEIVLLRYLVVSDINGIFNNKTLTDVTSYINTGMKMAKLENASFNNSIKRLDIELKKLKKNKLIKSISIEDKISKSITWIINFFDNMIIKINFINYPITPPDLHIVDFGTCDIALFPVNEQNKITIPILEPTNWNISIKINDVIKMIKK